MALKIVTEDDRNPGATVEAYAKIIGLHGERFENGRGKVQAEIAFFASEEAAKAKAARIGDVLTLWVDVDLNEPLHPQVYNAIKAYDPTTEFVPEKLQVERAAAEVQAEIADLMAKRGKKEGKQLEADHETEAALRAKLAGIEESRAAIGSKFERAREVRARLRGAKDA